MDQTIVLETANRVASDILAHRTGVEALRHIADAARRLVGARYAGLGVARAGGKDLSAFLTAGLTDEDQGYPGPEVFDNGILHALLRCESPLRLHNREKHSSRAGLSANDPRLQSFLGVPICRGNTVLGGLYLVEKIGAASFTKADEEAIVAMATHAAVAIHHLLLQEHQRYLVAGLIAAQEEERRTVAYDLHDGLTQFVMAAHAHLEASRAAESVGNKQRASLEINRSLSYLKEAVIESRRLVAGLRTLALDDLGLVGALEQLVQEEKTRAGWNEATFVHNIADRRFDKAVETAAYRVAQEGLTNARKHANTQNVRLLLLIGDSSEGPAHQRANSEESLTLEVRDWGRGFVPEAVEDADGHVGLHSMAERARLMDGQFDIVSAPNCGTVIRTVFPIVGSPKAIDARSLDLGVDSQVEGQANSQEPQRERIGEAE